MLTRVTLPPPPPYCAPPLRPASQPHFAAAPAPPPAPPPGPSFLENVKNVLWRGVEIGASIFETLFVNPWNSFVGWVKSFLNPTPANGGGSSGSTPSAPLTQDAIRQKIKEEIDQYKPNQTGLTNNKDLVASVKSLCDGNITTLGDELKQALIQWIPCIQEEALQTKLLKKFALLDYGQNQTLVADALAAILDVNIGDRVSRLVNDADIFKQLECMAKDHGNTTNSQQVQKVSKLFSYITDVDKRKNLILEFVRYQNQDVQKSLANNPDVLSVVKARANESSLPPDEAKGFLNLLEHAQPASQGEAKSPDKIIRKIVQKSNDKTVILTALEVAIDMESSRRELLLQTTGFKFNKSAGIIDKIASIAETKETGKTWNLAEVKQALALIAKVEDQSDRTSLMQAVFKTSITGKTDVIELFETILAVPDNTSQKNLQKELITQSGIIKKIETLAKETDPAKALKLDDVQKIIAKLPDISDQSTRIQLIQAVSKAKLKTKDDVLGLFQTIISINQPNQDELVKQSRLTEKIKAVASEKKAEDSWTTSDIDTLISSLNNDNPLKKDLIILLLTNLDNSTKKKELYHTLALINASLSNEFKDETLKSSKILSLLKRMTKNHDASNNQKMKNIIPLLSHLEASKREEFVLHFYRIENDEIKKCLVNTGDCLDYILSSKDKSIKKLDLLKYIDNPATSKKAIDTLMKELNDTTPAYSAQDIAKAIELITDIDLRRQCYFLFLYNYTNTYKKNVSGKVIQSSYFLDKDFLEKIFKKEYVTDNRGDYISFYIGLSILAETSNVNINKQFAETMISTVLQDPVYQTYQTSLSNRITAVKRKHGISP